MKKKLAILLIATMGLGLVACGAKEVEEPVEEKTKPVVEKPVEKEEEQVEVDTETKTLQAYEKAIKNLLENHKFPDGDEAEYNPEMFEDISQNYFAIYDFDQDGEKELLIDYFTCSLAGTVRYLYKYDQESDTLQLQLSANPDSVFYPNGLVMDYWSHNQGLGRNLQPYSLYMYNNDTDSYDFMLSVDSWEKEVAPTDYNGEPYPDDIDTEGYGTVYIMNDTEGETIMSGDEYDAWAAETFDIMDGMFFPRMNMSEEHISWILMDDVDRAEKSYACVEEYGYSNGYSNLSYRLLKDTAKDMGDYYQIEAVFLKAVKIPANMQEGESVTVTTNDLLGTTEDVTRYGEFYFGSEYGQEYYTYNQEGAQEQEIFFDSDDRKESQFFVGILRIAKDAKVGIPISEEYWTLEEKDFDGWYNGVKFAEDGMVTELLMYGD